MRIYNFKNNKKKVITFQNLLSETVLKSQNQTKLKRIFKIKKYQIRHKMNRIIKILMSQIIYKFKKKMKFKF